MNSHSVGMKCEAWSCFKLAQNEEAEAEKEETEEEVEGEEEEVEEEEEEELHENKFTEIWNQPAVENGHH